MRLLIVLPGALGDVVRGLPVVGRLRRAHPDATIAWVVEPLSTPVLEGHPWIDRVHRFERRRGVAGFLQVAAEIRRAAYDVALDLGRSAKSGLLTRASGAPRRIGFARADGREGGWLAATERLPAQGVERSKLEQFLAFGDRLGATDDRIEFGLTVDEAAGLRLVGDLGSDVVAACVGSSCPSRRWWPDRTAAVLDRLNARHGTTGVLLGTGADAEFARAVLSAARSPVRDLVGRTSVPELAAVLARSRVVFGPDSGALHLAAALGRPVVSLWGATSALRSAPFGSERWVMEGRAACSPCFLSRCPIGRVCMEDIAVATVASGAEEALAA